MSSFDRRRFLIIAAAALLPLPAQAGRSGPPVLNVTRDGKQIFDPREMNVTDIPLPGTALYEGVVRLPLVRPAQANEPKLDGFILVSAFRDLKTCELFFCGLPELAKSAHPQAKAAIEAVQNLIGSLTRKPDSIYTVKDGTKLLEQTEQDKCNRPTDTLNLSPGHLAI
jgi:hypothetical protein